VVATGFAVAPAPLAAGVAALGAMGFRVRLGESAHAREGYLAGTDELRARDLHAMLEDPEVRAVWVARGGFGTARLLDRIDWPRLGSDPKPLVGYSDLTALHAAVTARLDAPCLYGPVVAELGVRGSYHRRSLAELLGGREVTIPVRRRQIVVPGAARGRLAGGNLTVLTHLLGTPHWPELRGRVLFLEDVGEEAYRLDRSLTQLRQARVLDGLAGVLLGSFVVPRRRRFPPDRPVDAIFEETFGGLGVPVVAGLPVGHIAGKWTLPIGGIVEIDTSAGRVRVGRRS
jgi:muramoyltetrapeptide carboxypeptidase